jgi:peptidoglycan/LPS O-acetylase OafA/YrhL
MRALDEIIIGFLIFFIIDKAIRLFSNAVIEPWAESRTDNPNVVENWKISTELVFLIIVVFLLFKFRKVLQKLDT